ncbi:hypothetical protein C8Q73DRAFT_687287 [Cubamyces lactineus]|nr:hypothetical protein C8Q73DRAFT_699162 [Cubamyces lactineus]KAH9896824.1 hypothetical protein C8Q73DRAFT_687287 [Cubamyces lactineus]
MRRVVTELKDLCGDDHLPATLWRALRRDPVEPKVRDFVWKALHGAHRVGRFWTNVPTCERRAFCPTCGTVEDMDHILTACQAPGQRELWRAARDLGAPLYAVKDERGGVKQTASRLARIVLSETGFLIWKLRCERVIAWADRPGEVHSLDGILNAWHAALDRRLWLDQQRALRKVGGRKPLPIATVEGTWGSVIDGETDLGGDWIRRVGVLVGRRR